MHRDLQVAPRRMSISAYLAAMVLIIALPITRFAAAGALSSDLLVSPAWLHDRLSDPNLVIIDARAASDYASQHIPGASSIPDTTTFQPKDNYALISPISVIRDAFTRAGISEQRYVVVYDGGEFVQATRVFWVLEVYGHKSVYLLDSGLPGWTGLNYPTEQQTTPRHAGFFVPAIAAQYLATKVDTRLAIDSPLYVLIDSRDELEFTGQRSKNGKFGHIPSAINIPWQTHFNRHDGRISFRPLSELHQLYSVTGNRKVIAYCTYGNESSISYFTLRRLGRAVSVYDGSWAEWSSDQTMPQVTMSSP